MSFESNPVGNTPTEATPSVTPAPASNTGAPVAAAPTTPEAAHPQTPATGATGYAQVPSYRLREIRDQYEARLAQVQSASQSELEKLQKQIQALVGVAPQQSTPEAEVRKQFGGLYPGLSKLEERAAQIEMLLERAGDLETQTQHYWQTYGRQTLDNLFSKASATLGSELTPQGKDVLRSAFIGFVQSSPENQERYSNDPSIVDDFIKVFSSGLIDPVRRSATVNTANRVPGALPQDSPAGAPRTTPPPQLNGLDERANAAWAFYKQNARSQE